MRFPRVKAEGQGFYHIISRIVSGGYVFGICGRQGEDAEKFVSMIGSYSAFSGIQILDYSLMSNHFHMVCFVPAPRPLSVEDVLERIAARYPEKAQALRAQQARLAEQPDGLEKFDRLLDPYRRRMNDRSIFVKELKGDFAQWYNRKYNRYGDAIYLSHDIAQALWAERFKSVYWKKDEPWRR